VHTFAYRAVRALKNPDATAKYSFSPRRRYHSVLSGEVRPAPTTFRRRPTKHPQRWNVTNSTTTTPSPSQPPRRRRRRCRRRYDVSSLQHQSKLSSTFAITNEPPVLVAVPPGGRFRAGGEGQWEKTPSLLSVLAFISASRPFFRIKTRTVHIVHLRYTTTRPLLFWIRH